MLRKVFPQMPWKKLSLSILKSIKLVFLLSQIPTDTFTEKFYEQLCLPAVIWRGWGRFAGLQGRIPILSSAVISWTLASKKRVQKRFQNHWGQSGCSTWASVQTSLATVFAAFLLQWLTASPWWWTRVQTLTRQGKKLEDTSDVPWSWWKSQPCSPWLTEPCSTP